MFLDASAIVAMMVREPGYEILVQRMDSADTEVLTSAIARFEASLAVSRVTSSGRTTPETLRTAWLAVSKFLAALQAKDVPIDLPVGEATSEAAATYGKFVGHPANLNLGDCFAYACAKARDVPLLYKGDDFALTDLA